jgi:hypothetical protein
MAKTDLWVHAAMPAVTVEGGYLSNAQDAARFARPEVQEAMAQALREGVQAQGPEILQRKAELLAWDKAHPAPAPLVEAIAPIVFQHGSGPPLVPVATLLVMIALLARFRRGVWRGALATVEVGGVVIAGFGRRAATRSTPRRGRSRRRRRASVFELRRRRMADVTILPRTIARVPRAARPPAGGKARAR